MPGGNQIRFGIGFDVNKAGLNELKKSLLEIQQLSKKDLLSNFGGNEQKTIDALKKAKAAARELDAILTKTFNSNLGTVNISRFQSELNKLGADGLNRIYSDLSSIGAQGTNAFNKLATSAMTTNVKLKQTFSILESMKTTLANTVKWTIASSAVNALTGSVSSAFNYVKALDSSLTDIRIVTGQSREEMAQFAVQANAAAQALGRQTKEYTNAALTFYQQGLGEAEVQARTEATLKAQNVTGAGVEMADYLTAVWNGFKVSAENTELYVDKLAAVADSSASNMSELAIAMSKVASTANNMGVDMDQLTAQISTIVATTRQAPETVGNALKTIYARINDIKSGSDEAEISLGNYTGRMQKLGISVLDASGRLRDTGDVMEEIGAKWGTMTREQQIYLAQTMAGQRQMNNLIALFDNWGKYSEMLNVSLNAQGSLNEKNARYMDSLSAHINQFHAAVEGMQDTLIDKEVIKDVIDAGTGLVNLFNDLLISMGGMKGSLLVVSSLLLNTFSSNIADGILKINDNFKNAKDNAAALVNELEIIRSFNGSETNGTVSQLSLWSGQANQFQQSGVISAEQRAILNELMQQYNELANKQNIWLENEDAVLKYLHSLEGLEVELQDIDRITEEGADQFKEAALKITDYLGEQEAEVKGLEEIYLRLNRARERLNNDQTDTNQKNYNNQMASMYSELSQQYDQFRQIAEQPLNFGFDEESDLIKELRINLEEFDKDLRSNVAVEEYAKHHIEMYQKISNAMKQQYQDAQSVINQGVKSYAQVLEDQMRQIADTINATFDAAAKKEVLQGFIKGISGLSTGIAGIESFTRAIEAVGDKSLSASERFSKFIKGTAMSLTLLTSSYKQLSSSYTMITQGLFKLMNREAYHKIQEEFAIAIAKAKTAATKKERIELEKKAIATRKAALENLKEQASEVSLISIIKAKTAALWAQAKAWMGAHLAMTGVIALGVLAVGAAAIIISSMESEAKAAQEAAEQSAKKAAELRDKYNDVKQSFEDLKSEIEDYKDARAAIDNLVVGTQEWSDALQDVYDKVLALMEAYPELAQYVTYDKNGVPTISQEGMDTMYQLKREEVQAAQQRSIIAQRDKLEADLNLIYANTAKEAGSTSKAIKELYTELASNTAMYTDFIAAQGTGNFDSFIDTYGNDLGVAAEKAAQAIIENNINIKESIATVKTNTAAIDAQTRAFTDSVYSGNLAYQGYEYKEAVSQVIDKTFDRALNKISQDIRSSITPQNNSNDADIDRVFQEYMQIHGYTSYKHGGILGFSPDYDFKKDEEVAATGISGEEVIDEVASERARVKLENLSESILADIRKITDTAYSVGGEAAASAIANLIGSKDFILFDSFNEETIDKAKEALSTISYNQAQELLNSKIFTTDMYKGTNLQETGLLINKSGLRAAAEAYQQAVLKTLQDPELVSDDVLDIYGIKREDLNKDLINDVSLDNITQIGNLLEQAEKIGPDATNLIKQIFSGIKDPKQYTNFLQVLGEIDKNTSVEDLKNKLTEAGVELNGFDDSLLLLLNLFTGEGNIGDAVLASAEAIKKAKDIVSDIHYGDEISQEDFDALQRLGIENLETFFTMTLDGTYRLIGSSEKLRDTINQMQFDNFEDRVEEARENLALLNGLSGQSKREDTGESRYRAQDIWGDTEAHLNEVLPYIESFSANQIDSKDDALYQKIDAILQVLIAGGGTSNLSVDQLKGYRTKLEHGEFGDMEREELNNAISIFGTIGDHVEQLTTQLETMEGTLGLKDLDSDVNVEEFERMADYLAEYGGEIYGISEDLKGNYDAAKMIAEEFLRADAAAESVDKNIDKWTRSLADPMQNMEDYLESLEELDNAYKDLLNLSEGDVLSETFLQDAHNLQLMQDAINGSTEAYDELAEFAQQDILNQGLETLQKLNPDISINDEQWTNLENNLLSHVNEIENSIEGIEVGADLNDEGFIAELENLINAAGLTADQATALLASMGIDATVVEGNPAESSSTLTAQEYTGPTYTTETVPFGGPFAAGEFTYPRLDSVGKWVPNTSSNTETSPRPYSLKVTNATKGISSGGNISHKKLGGNSGSRKKSGGGGGGGGSKAKEPTKPFKSKIDPYHDVNIKIGNVKEGLDKLGKDRDKLIGKAAIENLRKQVDLMEQEKELLREKAEIAKSELQRQGQELANLGAIFDANGDIANYSQLLLDKQNQINEAITYGNTLQGDQRDAYDKYVKDLEQEYKDLETAIKDYDATQQLLDDLELDYADLINEQIEKAIEAFDLEIELHLDLKDAQKEFNEFRKKIIDQIQDDEFGRLAEATARNYQNYYNVGADGNVGGIIPELRQHVQQIYNELQVMTNGGFSQIYGDNLAAAAEDLKKYNDELMKNLEEAQDVIDETHQNFLDAIDSLSDAFDKQQEAFDKIDTFLEHDIELIQLVRGEEDYAALTGLWEQQVATDAQRLDKLRQQQDYWREQINQYEEGTDEWKAAMENWQESFEALNEAMINSVKNLQSQWENSINTIMKDLRNQAFGGNMNSALEQWEKMEWHSDRYLDSLSRANGLLDLQSQYTKAINETDDPKLRQQLTDLEEQQLEALSNKEHLREIDLKIAQQQLTVMQAQMALEDAQQSKTKMRLRRDSQGNYTYQYVADEDNIAEKTQEYANALEEYRTMVKESLHEDLQDLSDYTQEFFDKIQDAQMQFGDDAEALNARIAEITEQYTGPEGYITRLVEDANYDQQELQKATFTQAVELYGQLGEAAFDAFTGPDQSILAAAQELLDANNGKIPTLLEMFKDDTYQQFLDGITQDTWDQLLDPDHGLFHDWNSSIASIAQNYQEKFLPEVADAMYQLQVVHQAYLDGLGIIQNAANRTFGQIAAGLDADTGYSYSLITATDELVEAQKAQVEQANAVYDALKRNEEAFKDQTKAAIDAANAMFLYWLTLNGQTTSSLPYSVEGYTGVRSNPSSTKASPNNYSSSNSGGSSGSSGSSNNSASGNSGYTDSGSSGKYDWRGIPWEYSPDNPNRKKSASFASGGYTGSWGDNGRIAVLHQKELVLNEDDTKNVLNAVNITRAITSGVSSMAAAALSNLSEGRGYSTLESTTDSILQNVVINADFPAVQDAAQIKQAFNELVNIASQRASKNRRAY